MKYRTYVTEEERSEACVPNGLGISVAECLEIVRIARKALTLIHASTNFPDFRRNALRNHVCGVAFFVQPQTSLYRIEGRSQRNVPETGDFSQAEQL